MFADHTRGDNDESAGVNVWIVLTDSMDDM